MAVYCWGLYLHYPELGVLYLRDKTKVSLGKLNTISMIFIMGSTWVVAYANPNILDRLLRRQLLCPAELTTLNTDNGPPSGTRPPHQQPNFSNFLFLFFSDRLSPAAQGADGLFGQALEAFSSSSRISSGVNR